MELLTEYSLFLAKTLTAVIAILVVVATLFALAERGRSRPREHLRVRKLNQRFRDMENTLRHALMGRKALRMLRKDRKREKRQEKKEDTEQRKRVYMLRFEGDLRASRADNLREEVSAILTMARPDRDQVVVCLESAGGLVHSYGLAASQLARIRARKIPLTVAVDRVAASGGYLMAAVANRVVAAPFAIVGSIGVVAQIPNLHRFLRRRDVDIELLTAGEHKRTLTVLGKNTEAGRRKFQEDLDDIHALFKAYISRYRPTLDLEQVATGEHWFGEQALERKLVDELGTSDDLLMELTKDADVFEVTFHRRQPMGKRLTLAVENAVERILNRSG